MTDVFLDTVGMIAVWDDTDQWHADARAAYDRLLRQDRKLVTTPLVLCECGNASARRTYRTDVCELRSELLREGLLIEPTAQEIEDVWSAYERGEAGQAGIVDHLSFRVMRRLGLVEAFTNDKHFRPPASQCFFD